MKIYWVIGVLVVLGILGWLIYKNGQSQVVPMLNQQADNPSPTSGKYSFATPKKSLHYESNVPEHGQVLVGVPVNIVINFNFDLAKPSKIEILRDSQEFGEDETTIDTNKLSMRRDLKQNSPDGLYTVKYNACWPDGSCHDGNFQFVIDRSLASQFTDQTNNKEVTIKLSQIKFMPQEVKISKGTKVIWVNDEAVGHYINTDPHPGHNYYPAQNSKYLNKGESFSLTFDKTGVYPYHCSAHADTMLGKILVE